LLQTSLLDAAQPQEEADRAGAARGLPAAPGPAAARLQLRDQAHAHLSLLRGRRGGLSRRQVSGLGHQHLNKDGQRPRRLACPGAGRRRRLAEVQERRGRSGHDQRRRRVQEAQLDPEPGRRPQVRQDHHEDSRPEGPLPHPYAEQWPPGQRRLQPQPRQHDVRAEREALGRQDLQIREPGAAKDERQ